MNEFNWFGWWRKQILMVRSIHFLGISSFRPKRSFRLHENSVNERTDDRVNETRQCDRCQEIIFDHPISWKTEQGRRRRPWAVGRGYWWHGSHDQPASRWSVSKRKKTERQSRRLGQKRQRPKSSRPSHYKHICYLPRPPKVSWTDFHQTNSINSIVPLQFRLETNSAIETNPLILRKTRQSPSKEK